MSELKIEKRIECIACGRQIAKGYMVIGSIEIPCKCGVKNKIQADKKPEGRVKYLTGAVNDLGVELARRLPRR